MPKHADATGSGEMGLFKQLQTLAESDDSTKNQAAVKEAAFEDQTKSCTTLRMVIRAAAHGKVAKSESARDNVHAVLKALSKMTPPFNEADGQIQNMRQMTIKELIKV